MNIVARYIEQTGTLRLMLQLLTLVFVLLSLAVGDKTHYSGWQMLSSLIVPSLIPIVFFGMLLELLMSTVFMVDAEEPEQKQRFRNIVRVDLLLVIALLIFWVPVLTGLLDK